MFARILYVTANSHLGSTTPSLNAIIQQLRPRGVEPVLLFREPGPWQKEIADAGIPCHFDPLRWPDRKHPLRSLVDIWRLIRLVRHEHIDLIHCNEHEHYPLLRSVGRWTRTPIVATLHWNLEPTYGHWAFRAPYTPAALQFTSRKQLELSEAGLPPDLPRDRVQLLMSGLAIDDLLARGGDGSDLRAAWGVGPDTVVLGNASTIRPRKRLEDVIRLVARLRRRGLPVFGAIAGGGKSVTLGYPERLQQVLREEGVEDHCRLVGFISPITPFFRAVDVVVHTSDLEILSMSLCESQACGKPTLAYAVGGNPETLPSSWYVAALGDLDTLEQKLVQLVSDADFRRRCGEEAVRHVRENFDAPVLAARQAAIYEGILGRRFVPVLGRPVSASA